MLEVVKERLVASSLQLSPFEPLQHLILILLLEELLKTRLHQDVGSRALFSLTGRERSCEDSKKKYLRGTEEELKMILKG